MKNVYIQKPYYGKATSADVVAAEKIFELVRDFFGLTTEEFVKKSKEPSLSYARHVCQYLLWQHTNLSAKEVGKVFNQTDGSGCKYSLKVISGFIDVDSKVKEQIDQFEVKVKSWA